MGQVNIRWIGTAGFVFDNDGFSFAFDPFLSRKDPNNSHTLKASELSNVRAIFMGHGHFDHFYDVPDILKTSEAQLYAPKALLHKLENDGVKPQRLIQANESSQSFLKEIKIHTFKSHHVKFDIPLVLSTVKRCGFNECIHIVGLGVKYPAHSVRTYYFELKGKKFLFLSSAGCREDELRRYQSLEIDYLLMPLQGHSHIQKIAARMTQIINPKVVIPHHHDNFYHPMSQLIDLEVFKEDLNQIGFKGQFHEIKIFDNAQL